MPARGRGGVAGAALLVALLCLLAAAASASAADPAEGLYQPNRVDVIEARSPAARGDYVA